MPDQACPQLDWGSGMTGRNQTIIRITTQPPGGRGNVTYDESSILRLTIAAAAVMSRTDYTFHGPDGEFHYIDWGGSGPMAHFAHATGLCAGVYTPLANRLRSIKVKFFS